MILHDIDVEARHKNTVTVARRYKQMLKGSKNMYKKRSYNVARRYQAIKA